MATDLIRKVSDPIERVERVERVEREFGREMMALRNFTDRLWESPFMPMRWLREVNPFDMDMPAADVEEKNDQYVVKAALPGWKPEDVNITYEPGMVTIEGKSDETTEQKGDGKYHRKEIVHKSFTRSFSLPGVVKLDKAGAEFKDGLLTISLPKSEVVKPRQIKIAANGGK